MKYTSVIWPLAPSTSASRAGSILSAHSLPLPLHCNLSSENGRRQLCCRHKVAPRLDSTHHSTAGHDRSKRQIRANSLRDNSYCALTLSLPLPLFSYSHSLSLTLSLDGTLTTNPRHGSTTCCAIPTDRSSCLNLGVAKHRQPCRSRRQLLLLADHPSSALLSIFLHHSPVANLSHSTAKLDSHTSPPPLSYSPNASDRGRESTAESTPINTPVTTNFDFPRPRKEKDLYFSWHRKGLNDAGGPAKSLLSDTDLLFEDTGDCSFPLFPESPPTLSAFPAMATQAAPIDITTPPRYGSSSPRNQTSNLTSALQEAGAQDFQQSTNNPIPNGGNEPRPSISGRNDSISNGFGSYYGTGARPISMKDTPRRESNTGSFVGGMSWGGLSVGSWIRDDIMMAGTSPAMNQSPSFHSSSYLPKMEANFMKDFTCCGLTLDSLHDLLQHFEEAHAQASTQTLPRTSISGQGGLPAVGRNGATPAAASSSRSSIQPEPATYTQHGFQTSPRPQNGTFAPRSQRVGSDGFSKTNLSTVQDMDSLEDMEMDDAGQMPSIDEQQPFASRQQQQFNNQSGNLPQLNLSITNGMQNQGLRTSTPNTPLATASPFGLQNNPTVSSVNTPTLSTAPLQQQNRTPDSSTPGTPAEFDQDFTMFPHGMGMNNQGQGDMNFNMNFGTGMAGFDGTIDQPAKRLFSKAGSGLTQQQLAAAFRNAQGTGDTHLQQQLLANMQGIPEEVKPFRCPVIGCEKAYKNQNGLKYHKQHGHQNQKLKDNEDGTYSIVDPVTSIPYPGSVGMEKEKPYRCEFCGKRYKNLNGLKYHRQHSANCNPEFKINQLGGMPNLQGMNVNVAGAGLTGMDGNMF